MQTLQLDGIWKVCDAPLSLSGLKGLQKIAKARSGWMPARVPGEIHLDLMRVGRMEEPLVGLNAKKSRWPEQRSWWYVKTFTVDASFLAHELQQLIFDGLDFYAQIFLNGEFLGETRNAFVPNILDVRHRLRKGRNTLVVRLTAGTELVPDNLKPTPEERAKRQSFRGIGHLRKPQFSYGWDWVDILPNIGIWRGVRLEGRSGIILHDVSATTRIRQEEVFLDVTAVVENLHAWSERRATLLLSVTPPKGRRLMRRIELSAQVGRMPITFTMPIPHPQLWWPNGMGAQPLYQIKVNILSDGTESDRREFHVGLRTVALDRSRTAKGGEHFCIRVNGRDVFCKGANWVPADPILARVSDEKYRTLIADAKNAHFNMLRVWGGGVYEVPAFYDACDRSGILVWQDFMFACNEYPDGDEQFRAAVRAEAEWVVANLRHHPCIALWCGNNENVWAFADWWNSEKKFGDKSLRVGGSIMYNQVLPDVCRALDPGRPYWPGSPCGGNKPNDESAGDCHWWGPCIMHPDVARRIDHEVFDECTARFVSEYGVLGPCHLDSVAEYLDEKDRHVDSKAWKEHTNPNEKGTLAAAIAHHYADLNGLSLEDFTRYAQMFQATMYGRTLEALRFRKYDPRHDCQGALIWMFNDCWGETGWTPIDYYMRRKPSYYWIRNAFAPVKTIVRRRGTALVTRLVNDSLDGWQGIVRYGWMRVDGTDARLSAANVRIGPNSMLEVGRDTIPAKRKLDPRAWIYAAYIEGNGVEANPSIWSLKPHRELALVEPKITVTSRDRRIRFESDAYSHGIHFDDRGGRLFSDNYFDLLPGVPKVITCLAPAVPKCLRFRTLDGRLLTVR